MTIGFRPLTYGMEGYRAVCCPMESTYEESQHAIAVIEATGNSHFAFPAEKLPVVVAALRLAGFEVK